MAFFKYKAKDESGQTTFGLVEAPNQTAAVKLIHARRLLPINLHEQKNQTGGLNFFRRVGFGETVKFTRQLSTMITAGLSIPESLTLLCKQTNNQTMVQMLGDIERQIVGGGNLADALARYPDCFSPIYIALIRAGEASGTLDQVFARLANNLEKQQNFNSQVRGAMIYPMIIVIGMIVVVFIMMTIVIPKLTGLYKDFGLTLPPTTQLLISVSNFFVHFWWLIILSGIGAAFGLSRWRATDIGRRSIDLIWLRIPILGDLSRKIILVEFSRTLAMLLTAGIHILDGLKILRGALGNVLFRDAIDEISKAVEKGTALGDSFAKQEVFPPIITQMVRVGEETGKLDETLNKLSAYFEAEAEQTVKSLTTAIEPIIMVILGVGVGFIVISVITPIYNLTSQFK